MEGIVLAVVATALLVFAGVQFAGWLLPEATFAERCVAGLTLSFVFLIVSAQVLSAVGFIGRIGFLAATVVWFVVGVALAFRHGRNPAVAPRASSTSFGWPVAILAAAVGVALSMWLWRGIAQPVLVVSDGPIYHLPFAVRWLQDGSLTRVWTPFGELAASYFPGNGELWLCWLLALVGDDRLAKVGQWFFVLSTMIAVYALGRNAGGDRWSACLGPLVWASCLLTYISTTKPDVDLPMAFLLLAGLLFLDLGWRSSDPSSRRRCLAISAMAFGAAAGTKSIGLLFGLAPMIVLLLLLARDWKGLTSAAVAAAASSGFWYIRNFVETGNPIYPMRISLGGTVLFDGWYDAAVMRGTSAYHAPVWDFNLAETLLGVCAHPRLWQAMGLALAVGAVVAAFTRNRDRRRTLILCIGASVVWAASYWFIQPYNTQQRFLLSALAAACAPTALAIGPTCVIPAGLSAIAIYEEHSRGLQFDVRLGALAAAWSIASLMWLLRPRFGWAAISLALFVAASLAPTVWTPRAEAPKASFYSSQDFGERLLPAWSRIQNAIETSPRKTAVVGYAGTNLPYYLAGPALANRVRYVNVQGEADWLPHHHFRVHRSKQPTDEKESAFPQWHRSAPDREAWLRNLDALGVEYFLIARENFHGRSDAPTGLPPFPIERQWLTSMADRFERLGPDRSPLGEEPWGIAFRVRLPHRPP